MSKDEDEIQDIVTSTFTSIDKGIEELGKIPQSAKKKTDALLAFFDGNNLFEKPSEFLRCVADLSEEIGHANHVVLEIDLRRQGIIQSNPSVVAPPVQNVTSQTERSGLIIQTQPQKGGGFMDYLSSRKMAGVWEKYLEKEKEGEAPQITTSKETTDVLDYGRQLIRENNRIFKYYEQSLAHLKFFNDSETEERLKSNLREHMNKISGIIRAFCRTAVEYRKELAGERKSEMAKAVIGLKMAELQGGGGMTLSEAYRMMRETMGAQDAGR